MGYGLQEDLFLDTSLECRVNAEDESVRKTISTLTNYVGALYALSRSPGGRQELLGTSLTRSKLEALLSRTKPWQRTSVDPKSGLEKVIPPSWWCCCFVVVHVLKLHVLCTQWEEGTPQFIRTFSYFVELLIGQLVLAESEKQELNLASQMQAQRRHYRSSVVGGVAAGPSSSSNAAPPSNLSSPIPPI